ncbi:hypothetical protein Poli38472_003442 [Pythium oligandrum]|uniref:Uncharacterized protein n=1 Tax=Pythium oligandrum TaxID=41045 RepID=A0A8K1C6M5_PYTOL|nr:hypothetical protein Poli38472_003442 [Pythium oligandrum]|eukprot:TMW57517.1 hypothetical protein Poli38472_003442 [Pythium oligandrum]
MLLLRYDVIKLLLGTYDFWFFTVVNTATCVLLGRGFSDARVCVSVLLWIGNLHSSFVDANTRLACYLIMASLFTAALELLIMLSIESTLIKGWASMYLFTYSGHEVFSKNVLSNGLTSMLILLLRNVYRRHMELTQQKKLGCQLLRCINYRARVQFAACSGDKAPSYGNNIEYNGCYLKSGVDTNIAFPVVSMAYVRVQQRFNAMHTFFPIDWHSGLWPLWSRVALWLLGITGLALPTAVFITYPSSHGILLAIVGLVCTLLFVGIFFGLYQRELFRHLTLTFDFLFLSCQLSLGLLSVAWLFRWDARALPLVAMWLWLHWVITIDALTPCLQHKIGFCTRTHVLPVLLLFLAAQLAIASEVLMLDHWGLHDRVIVALAFGLEIRVLPFFFSRLLTTFLWSGRLAWRAAHASAQDMTVVLGRVGYKYFHLDTEAIKSESTPMTSVMPAS